LKFFSFYATRGREREVAQVVRTNQEKREKNDVCEWCPKWGERSLLFIQFVEGEETHPLGFLSLHLLEADLDNLCMRENKFKISLLLVWMRWSLYQNWTSQKEGSNAIIISIIWVFTRWNLFLVSNSNTPSQLGIIPPANPSVVIIPSCHHVPSLSSLLYSIEPWSNNEEEAIESESEDLTTLHWQKSVHDPRSSCWTPCILVIGSTEVHNASISIAMVPNHFSQLLSQMRGISHESQTPWVGCVLGHQQEKVNHSPYIHVFTIIGEGEQFTLHTCQPSWGITREGEPLTLNLAHD